MKKFKLILNVILTIFVLTYFVIPSMAAEKATKEECMVKVKEAVKMIKEKGLEATLKTINDKKGPFVWKDAYVFCIDDEKAKFMAHPYLPQRMIGWSMIDWRDSNGMKAFEEFVKLGKAKGEGWVSYMHAKQQGAKPRPKSSYIYRIPDQKVIVGAGIYE